MKKLTLILSIMIALVGLNANAAIYIVGDGPLGGWSFNGGIEMFDSGNGVYVHEMTIPEDAESATVYFVFANDRGYSWAEFNDMYRIGPTNGNIKIEDANWIETQKAGGDNGAYYFMGIKGESYTVTYDSSNSKFKVDGAFEQPHVGGDTYTVAGSNAALFGTTWAQGNTDNDMTLVDGLYTWSKDNVELSKGAFEFKVVVNHDWGEAYPASNYNQPVAVKGIYNVKITFNAETKDVACELTLVEELPDEDVHTYTVAGSSAALFGTEWDAANEDNNMKLVEGLYTFTKNNVELTAGTIEFKVVEDHNWDIAYPSQNWIATIDENGIYNVTITFNPENQEIDFQATVAEVIDDFYTVAGAPEALFGAEWNPGYADNNMTLVDGVYTWTKNDVELTAGYFIEFKVVKNNNWTTAWPANNYEYTVAEDGTYDLVITFNPETEEVVFTANKHQEAPAGRGDVDGDGQVNITDLTMLIDLLLNNGQAPAAADCDLDGNVNIADVAAMIDFMLSGNWPAIEMVYTVVGVQNVFGSSWDPTDENNNMVKGADGVYTWSKTGVTLYGNFEFKVVGNHDWSIYEWPIGMNNWVANVAEEGVYDIVITFNPDAPDADRITCTLTKTGDVDPIEHTYTVAGAPSSLFGSTWDPSNESNDMVKGADGKYTWKYEGYVATGAVEVEFKVVKDHSWDNGSFPASNYATLIGSEGYPTTVYIVTITFDPNADDENKIQFSALPVQIPE